MYVLNLFQDLFICCLKILVWMEIKDKLLVRTENSSSVIVWLERLFVMYLLYWKVYVSMDLVMNLQNDDLY